MGRRIRPDGRLFPDRVFPGGGKTLNAPAGSGAADARRRIRKFYDLLRDAYGPQDWWPAETRFECAAGAILTQNASWKNVEKAIGALRENSMLDAESIRSVSEKRLSSLIRPCGYHNLKAARLKNFAGFLFASYGGEMENMLGEDAETLREELLGVNGVGEETADSILLYALGKPAFVVDAYTKRILSRHGLVARRAGYGETQKLFTESLPPDARTFNEYHALIVRAGKLHCSKTASCAGCPLEGDPHDPRRSPLG